MESRGRTVATRGLLNVIFVVLVSAASVLDPVVRLQRREVLPKDLSTCLGIEDLEGCGRLPRPCCGEGKGETRWSSATVVLRDHQHTRGSGGGTHLTS